MTLLPQAQRRVWFIMIVHSPHLPVWHFLGQGWRPHSSILPQNSMQVCSRLLVTEMQQTSSQRCTLQLFFFLQTLSQSRSSKPGLNRSTFVALDLEVFVAAAADFLDEVAALALAGVAAEHARVSAGQRLAAHLPARLPLFVAPVACRKSRLRAWPRISFSSFFPQKHFSPSYGYNSQFLQGLGHGEDTLHGIY